MDIEFSSPLKFYHTYLENIYAPQGLRTSSRHLERNKWRCLGTETQLEFTIRKERNYIIVKVTNNGQALDYAVVNSYKGREMMQFCARKPSISCKYMISPTHMRRFQVAFANDSDFLEANNRIIGLGLIVVRAQIPPVNSQSATIPQYNTQTPLQSILSLLTQTATAEDNFPHSQLNSETSTNIQEKLEAVKRATVSTTFAEPERVPNPVQSQESQELRKRNLVEDRISFPHFNDSIVAPSIPLENGLALNSGVEILASQPYQNTTIENRAQKDSLSPPLGVRYTLPQELTKPPPAPLSQLPAPSAPLAQFQTSQTPKSAPQASIVNSQIPIQTSRTTVVHPLALATTSLQNQENNEINDKSKKLENNSNTTIPEVRISKKLIKRKLKDKKFLKWVAKVEGVLSEMIEKKS